MFINRIKKLKELVQMSFQRYFSYKTGKPIDGFAVTLEPDWKCNARCNFCNRWRKVNLNILSKSEIFKIIDDIKGAGGKTIVLGGGEPLLRRDIFEIIQYAKSKNLSVVMNTNGQLLPRVAGRLAKVKIDGVIVSIDSPNPSIHDEIRGVKGIFEKALEGSIKLKEYGVSVTIGGVLTKDTLSDMEGLIDLAAENKLGVRFQPVHQEPLNNLFSKNADLGFSDYTEEDIRKRIDKMITHYESRIGPMSWVDKVYYALCPIFLKNPQKFLSIKCTVAARNRYFIDPEGNVFPCESRRDINFGNVRNQRFKEIINSVKAKSFRRSVLRGRKCVCWWRCEALDMIRDQFVPFLPVKKLFLEKLWKRKIQQLKEVPRQNPQKSYRNK